MSTFLKNKALFKSFINEIGNRPYYMSKTFLQQKLTITKLDYDGLTNCVALFSCYLCKAWKKRFKWRWLDL